MNQPLRPLLFVAAFSTLSTLVAQSEPTPPKTTPPPDRTRTEPVPSNRDHDSGRTIETTAGSPKGELPGVPVIEDRALGNLMLDPGQLERIQRMDVRYASQLDMLRPVKYTDAVYLGLWHQREREIADILTPLQFERWKELNRSMVQSWSAPVPVHNAPVDDIAPSPRPGAQMDSTRAPQPVLDSVPQPPPTRLSPK